MVKLVEFLAGSSKADLETVSFAEPSLVPGFCNAGDQVVANLYETATLGQVGPQQRAADAGVFVDARGGKCTGAGANGDLASLEVTEKLLPLFVGRGAVLLTWSQRPSPS